MRALTHFAVSAALHLMLVVLAALVGRSLGAGIEQRRAVPPADQQVRHIVFVLPETLRTGSGGGGGGNRQPGPTRRAEGVGPDRSTLRVRQPPPAIPVQTAAPPATEETAPLPSLVLEAKPLAAGLFEQIGLPAGGAAAAVSTGPGSGGGVGSGNGTGTGSGDGPGLGPGSGGSAGGGVYRPGGAVSAPRLIEQVRPKYTADALRNRIQGTVVLEAVVTADGCVSQVRVVRSLDRAGLDDAAMAAAAQWRFEPGRLAGAPVDVLIVIMLDFWIH